MKPRDYQEYAVNSVFEYFTSNKGNPVIAMPTGTGKSLVIADFVKKTLMRWPDQRIIMLTHVKELIEQNYSKLLTLWPTAPAGIYSAGIGRKEIEQITFAGIQSIAKVPEKCGHVDLILVDECHLIPKKSNAMYRKFINFLLKVNPHLKVIGLTATPYRVGLGMITDEDGIFDEMCCDMTSLEAFNWFFDEGYLTTLIPMSTVTTIDTSSVGTQLGDFKQTELAKVTDKDEITHNAVIEMVNAAEESNRKHWLIFGTGIDHVLNIVTELQAQGISATCVHSKMSSSERDDNIAAFMKGEVTALVNNGILTTGFDAPFVDMLGILRATKSPGLWVQILGRGTRTMYAKGYNISTREGRLDAIANGVKPNCLVLDFAGNTKRLGPINDPVLPKAKGKGGGEAPVRECECGALIHASLRVCPVCGTEFPPSVKFKAKASDEELIARKKKEEDGPLTANFKVDLVTFNRKKSAKGPYIELVYHCGLTRYKMPLCLEHQGYARTKSEQWWRQATGADDYPDTLDEALERWDECRTPTGIRVWVNKKPRPEIKFIDYDNTLELNDGPVVSL